jgi:hypothetical protein
MRVSEELGRAAASANAALRCAELVGIRTYSRYRRIRQVPRPCNGSPNRFPAGLFMQNVASGGLGGEGLLKSEAENTRPISNDRLVKPRLRWSAAIG